MCEGGAINNVEPFQQQKTQHFDQTFNMYTVVDCLASLALSEYKETHHTIIVTAVKILFYTR